MSWGHRAAAPNQGLQPTASSVCSYLGLLLPCFFHVYGYRPLSTHTINRLILAPDPAQKLSPQISVELVGSEEVFGRYADGIISQPL
jgi:hypothetical protein